MIVGFTTTHVVSDYHQYSCEFESQLGEDTTLCDKVCQWHAAGQWFSTCTPVSSTNKTERHDITELLLKVALNTITPNPIFTPNEITGCCLYSQLDCIGRPNNHII